MKRLKVLFITPWYPTAENPVSGIFVREHAKAAFLYNDVVVLHLDGYSQSVKGAFGFQVTIQEGIRSIRFNYRKFPIAFINSEFVGEFNSICSAMLAFRRICKEGFKPDIIHANVYTSGILAVIIGKVFRIPVVITEHFSAFPRKILSKREINKAKFAFKRAQYVLPVCKSLQEAIEFYGIKASFKIIPNAVDTSVFYYDASIKKDENFKQVLFVGLLSPQKGLEYLLRACRELKDKRHDIIINIIGDGPNRQEYERLANGLGISDVVKFHGIKTKKEIADFMRRSHIFILTSLYENLPCVLIEALTSGLPIVATNVGGIPEIINENVGILVEPKNSHTFAIAIENMIHKLPIYPSLEISEYSQKKFSYEAIGEKLNDIYNSCIR